MSAIENKISSSPSDLAAQMNHAEFCDLLDAMPPSYLPESRSSRSLKRSPRLGELLGKLEPLSAFLNRDIPSLERIYGDWLTHPGIGLIYGPTGVGKSWLAMDLAVSLAIGRPFLDWEADRSFPVWFLDGENGSQVLQERFRVLCPDGSESLFPISVPEWEVEHGISFDLADEATQNIVLEWFDCDGPLVPKFMVFDNVTTLFGQVDQLSNSEVEGRVMAFLVALKARGISPILVDHTGKEAQKGARGASVKEDRSEWILKMGFAKGHLAKVVHKKQRHAPLSGGSFVIDLVTVNTDSGERLRLAKDGRLSKDERHFLMLINEIELTSIRQIAEMDPALGKSKVERLMREATSKGLIEKDGHYRVTEYGFSLLSF